MDPIVHVLSILNPVSNQPPIKARQSTAQTTIEESLIRDYVAGARNTVYFGAFVGLVAMFFMIFSISDPLSEREYLQSLAELDFVTKQGWFLEQNGLTRVEGNRRRAPTQTLLFTSVRAEFVGSKQVNGAEYERK